jgi:hypothetical protein
LDRYQVTKAKIITARVRKRVFQVTEAAASRRKRRKPLLTDGKSLPFIEIEKQHNPCF